MSAGPAPGELIVRRWWLRRDAPPPAVDPALRLRAGPISVPDYRHLYHTVGEPWLWGDRRRWSDAALAVELADPGVEVHALLGDDGAPAGFFELNFRPEAAVDLAYFGLTPGQLGRGLGPKLLNAAVARAATRRPGPLTVNTCSLDHPKALAVYQRAGFEVVREETEFYRDPRLDDVIPRGAAPQIPLATG